LSLIRRFERETALAKITTIDYEQLMQESLRDVMKKSLTLVAKEGLPGNHHFYISFKTNYPGVDLPDYLREEYPDAITIVLQYEYWDLEINEKSFYITLCFNDVHERIAVPYGAVISFVDPSVKFGIHFSPADIDEEAELISLDKKPEKSKNQKSKIAEVLTEATDDGSNVITLDAFRRK
jgi:hypothetical protein